MKALALTILSVLATFGAFTIIEYFFYRCKSKSKVSNVKFILYLPPNSEAKLEGIIRQIFLFEIPEKLDVDGKVYLIINDYNENLKLIVEDLKKQYPIEVLPDPVSYCMITERDK